MLKKLAVASISAFLLITLGCVAPPKNYQRDTTKQIDEYHTKSPSKSYMELQRISVSFREFGYATGTGTDEMIIGMLKDKAATIGADAIMNISVDSKSMSLEGWNLIWTGSAVAIKYQSANPNTQKPLGSKDVESFSTPTATAQESASMLHDAALKGDTGLFEALVKAGEDIDAKDKEGNTPLHNAASGGHVEIVNILIEAGADVNAKSNKGITPFKIAVDKKHKDVYEALYSAGAVYK